MTAEEEELARRIVALIQTIPEVQSLARDVKENGGDVQRAVMSLIVPEDRAAFAMQWPMIAMFLGV